MAQDDLERPIRIRDRKPGLRRFVRFDPVMIVAFAAGAALAVGGLWALLVRDPLGGEPVATAAIERLAPKPAAPEHGGDAAAPSKSADGEPSTRNGIPVVRPGDPMPKSGPVIISIPGSGEAHASPAGSGGAPGQVQTAMLEDSRYGPLPRIASDGRRPLDAYSRGAQAKDGAPRIALVVAGLGTGREATLATLDALPADVTFAFSPYGQDVADLVDKAREAGHEVLIQAPMEPFAYPANDPGPQTLLTSLPTSANLERLRWALGRAKGYVGVAPLGGGRFLVADDATAPVFTELARRGLMFVGQGAGGESKFPSVADKAGLAHARPATQIDATADAAAIDAALADLEREARTGVVPVGWASATPLTLKRIEAWRQGLPGRGVTLIPISAAGRPQGPS